MNRMSPFASDRGVSRRAFLKFCALTASLLALPSGAAPAARQPAGLPLIPEVMSAVLAHRMAFGRFPELDARGRPVAFYGETVHDRCSRRGHYEDGRFAKSFDDEGARAGWCLLGLGCKGPVTRNACFTVR